MFFALSCLSGITLSAMKTYRKKDYPPGNSPKAHVAVSSKYPKTLYRGDGVFMISGGSLNRTRKFKPQNL